MKTTFLVLVLVLMGCGTHDFLGEDSTAGEPGAPAVTEECNVTEVLRKEYCESEDIEESGGVREGVPNDQVFN